MSALTMNRRDFLGSAATAAAAGSLVFGFPTMAAAQGAAPEINAWDAITVASVASATSA